MKTDQPGPLIHVPARPKIVATLAALPDGDALSFTRQPDMTGLTPRNLLKREDARYLTSEKTGNGAASRTTLAPTRQSRTAPASCTAALRDLLGGLKTDTSRAGLARPVLGSLRTRAAATASDLAHPRTPAQPPPA